MKNEIAYQNKDITSKIFAEHLSGKSFKVYGVDIPKIKQVLPTNLPMIQANELKMDNLFLLEDDSFLLVDYESSYTPKNKLKYISYILRVVERYAKEYGYQMKIRMLVIYTADVLEEKASNTLDVFSLRLNLEQAFLSKFSSEKIKNKLIEKINKKEKLTDEEVMEYIILPLTYPGLEQKKEAIQELFVLAKEVEEETQLFLLAGILVFTDKVIDGQTAQKIKEWIKMTKVARLFEEEKEEAVEQAVEQERKAKEQAVEQEKRLAREAAMETAMETAMEMLKEGDSIEKIIRCNKSLSINDIEKLKKKLNL